MSVGASEDQVFAAYGRAMNKAQVLEHWLRVLVTIHRTASREFESQEQVERAVAALSSSTMGTVFAALRRIHQDEALEIQLEEAVAERNRLAHQYFGNWDDRWVGEETNREMIDDADRVGMLFEGTIAWLMPIIEAHLDAISKDPDSFVPGLGSRIAEQLSRSDWV